MTSPEQGKRTRRGPVARITNAAAGAIDVNSLVELVDVEAVVERIDIEAVVERIDVDDLVRRVDLDDALRRVDINAILDRIDPDSLLDRIDPDRLLDRIDPDRLLDRVDPDRLLDRVDPDRLLDRVDVNRVLDRVEPNDLLDRVDPDRLLDRVDMDRVMDRVNVAALVDRAGVSDIVSDSTGQVAESVLDALRRQLVALDEIVGRLAFRMVGKNPRKAPEGPERLVTASSADEQGRALVSGHYAGPVSRLMAFFIDFAVVFGAFTLVSAGVKFLVTELLGLTITSSDLTSAIGILALVTWESSYMLVGLVLTGSSVGKATVGLKVVSRDGSPITGRKALIRTVTYPLSFIFFGIGLLGIAFGYRHLAWHDKFAGTAVVIDWGDRTAALPAPLTQWLSARSALSVTADG